MAYVSWSVVFGEQPSAAKWNILGTNDSSFNDGTGIGSDAIKSSQMFYGLVRNRKGGTSGDATWITQGSTSTATDGKDVFFQVGSSVLNTAHASTAVTFTTAYTYAPLVFCTTITATSTNDCYATARDITTTGFNLYNNSAVNGTTENAAWLAIGQ